MYLVCFVNYFSAVVATVKMVAQDKSISKKAWQRFLPTGPLALLPLHDDYYNIVWSTSVAHAKRLRSLTFSDFLEELNCAISSPQEQISPYSYSLPSFLNQPLPPAFSKLLPILFPTQQEDNSSFFPPLAFELVQPLKQFPLRFENASSYVSKRLALIGDSAHVMHPLAGQGANLGYSDAKGLMDTIVFGLESGQDIGDMLVLERYNAKQRIHNHGVLAVNHLLSTLFLYAFSWMV